MKILEGKVALITGSTHGIGKAIALKLAQNHFALAINGATTKILPDSYIDSLKDIYNDELENHVIYVQADISNKDQRNQLINKIKDKFNRIDVLINNAGVAPLERNDILAATEESYERVMKINLQGPYFLTQSIEKKSLFFTCTLGGVRLTRTMHEFILGFGENADGGTTSSKSQTALIDAITDSRE